MKKNMPIFVALFIFLTLAYIFYPGRIVEDMGTVPFTERKHNVTKQDPPVPKTWADEADRMVLVDIDGVRPFFIDQYEATISENLAWSVAGLQPTTKITPKVAMESCAAAGKRLCTTQEWRIGCRDGKTTPHLFQNTASLLQHCDFGRSKGYDKNDYAGKNNSHSACRMPRLNLHHMIGNVAEMTQGANGKIAAVGVTYLGTSYYGAAFVGDPHRAMRMACEYTITNNYPMNRFNQGMGFRCCRDVP